MEMNEKIGVLNINRVLLERINFRYGIEIPKDVANNFTIDKYVDFLTPYTRVFFNTFIMGREVKKEITEQMKIYNSWWDHFKGTCLQPYLPIWLMMYFPAKYHLQPIVTRHFHLCPHTGLDFNGHNAIKHFDFLNGKLGDA